MHGVNLICEYRIYMTEFNGRIRFGQDPSCQTDEQARSRAIGLVGLYHRVEVWAGTRRVCVETSREQKAAENPLA